MNTQLTRIDDVIRYQIGSIIIALQWVAIGAYTVVTTNGGIDRIEDNCGSYPTEAEARAVARLYAEMYKAEHEASTQPATLDTYRQASTRRAAITTEPQDRVLAQADHNGYIRRGKTAGIRQLIALDRMGLVKLDRRLQGRLWVTFGATLTAKAERRVAA